MKKVSLVINLFLFFFILGCSDNAINESNNSSPNISEDNILGEIGQEIEDIPTLTPNPPSNIDQTISDSNSNNSIVDDTVNNPTNNEVIEDKPIQNNKPIVEDKPIVEEKPVVVDTKLLKAADLIYVNVLSTKTLHLPEKVLGYQITWSYSNTFFTENNSILTVKNNTTYTTTLKATLVNGSTSKTVYVNVTVSSGLITKTVQHDLEINYKFISDSKKIGSKIDPSMIVFHNTANSASAYNEVAYLASSANTSSTSYHFAVDNNNIYQAIPTNYVAYHAGNRTINNKSIGIEIAKSTISDTAIKDKAIRNAQQLIVLLKTYYYIDFDQIITHKDASGKYCPHDILDRYGLQRFYGDLEEILKY